MITANTILICNLKNVEVN